jgi:hypothetical protein
MSALDSGFNEALRYAISNCPARTTGQLAAIDYAERVIRQGPAALSPLERRALTLELGFWLDRYQRLQEFSGQRLADTDARPLVASVPDRNKAG